MMSTTAEVVGHFNARLAHAVELCQLDLRGSIIGRDRQTMFCAGIPILCVTDDNAIDVGVSLYVEIPIKCLTEIDDGRRLAAVAYSAAKEAIPRLAKYPLWNLYDLHRGAVPRIVTIPAPAEEHELKQDEYLSDTVVDQLTSATAFHRDVATAFEKAKSYLESNLNYLRDDPSRARRAAWFVTECMRSDAAPNMGMWNREKASRLVGEVDDLIRRRNSNHPGYRRAAESIGSILYVVHPPKAWAKHPPSPTLLNL
jgi:hypothetical protein